MEKTGTTTIRQDVLLTAAIMAASLKHASSIEDISSLLIQLKKSGIDLGEIALRRVPSGFYSEDVESENRGAIEQIEAVLGRLEA